MLRASNSVWVEQTAPVRPEYLQAIRQHYGEDAIQSVNFARDGAGAAKAINRSIADVTEGAIPELLPSNLLTSSDWQNTQVILTNALFFKGHWAQPFDVKNTVDRQFTRTNGNVVSVPFMREYCEKVGYAAFEADGSPFATPHAVPAEGERPPCYPGDGGFTMLELPYRGDTISMVFLLPRTHSGLGAVESLLTGERLTTWLGNLRRRNVIVGIPRFQFRQSLTLAAPLRVMGLKKAFDPDEADFGGMFDLSTSPHRSWLSVVIHQASVEVTERGTVAAAATAAAAMVECADFPTVPFDPRFEADHPFLFLIRDQRTGQILFLGRFASPGDG